MLKRVVLSLGFGFIIALVCALGFPSLQRIVSPILCYDGQLIELPAEDPATIRIACKRGAAQESIGLLPYLVVATLGYGLIAAVLIGLIGEPMARSFKQIRADQQRQLDAALPATATVIDARDGGMAMSTGAIRRVKLELDLEIMPDVAPAYTVTVRWMVSELHFSRVQPGCSLNVKIDAADPLQIYPAESWITR